MIVPLIKATGVFLDSPYILLKSVSYVATISCVSTSGATHAPVSRENEEAASHLLNTSSKETCFRYGPSYMSAGTVVI